MQIIKAETAGFCFGVEKAVKTTFDLADSGVGKIYTLGPVIHNDTVINNLKEKGVKVVLSIDEIAEPDATVIIRAHGVPKETYDVLNSLRFKVVDATCPYVKKIQKLAEKNYLDGYQIVITGDKNHPEVVGINGWCNNTAILIDNPEDVEDLPSDGTKYCLLSQTTFNKVKWENILATFKNLFDKSIYFDTICNATTKRQEEAARIASDVDLMIIIGDRKSSNTKKLFEICSEKCSKTLLVESPSNLEGVDFKIIKKTGITAGASTPDPVIREVTGIMSEMNSNSNDVFATMLEESLITLTGGQTVKGPIIRIDNKGVYIDLGFKYEGFISIDEFADEPKIGDEVEAVVVRVNDKDGEAILSKRKVDSKKNLKEIQESFENQTPVSVKVTEVVNGGLVANAGGVRVFIPSSLVDERFVNDLTTYLKKKLDVIIVTFEKGDRGRLKIVGSHKLVVSRERAKASEEVWSGIEVGKAYPGKVKSLTSFGAFVDIGGVDGLVHLTELSWSKIKHPSQVLKVGDEIEVTVLKFDPETKKISLGYRKPEDNPWTNIQNRLAVGDVVTCKVVRFVPFGVFVEIQKGIDGLVHISQISNVRLNKASDVLKMGQEVEAKVVEMDVEAKKINLSIKEIAPIDPVRKSESEDIILLDEERTEDLVVESVNESTEE